MKSNVDLLRQYKEEKALVIGSKEERTDLEPFPTFGQWKEVYTLEYNETHKTVTVEEADAEFDAAVEEADAELQAIIDELGDVDNPTPKKIVVRKKVTKRKVRPSAKVEKVSRTKVKRAIHKMTKKRAKRKSKIEKAETIFNRFYGRKTRSEIIEKLVNQIGLTQAGASTYYQKLKKTAG